MRHPALSAALLFALFVLLYLGRALIGGDMLSPMSMLYGFAPWQGLVPHDIRSFSNELLSDVATADYPWRFLVRQMLHAGTFPSWNPYVLGGIPLWSQPQTGLFSLFSVPLWILPLNYAIGVGAALKLWAAGFGTFLLVRQLRLGFLPGLLAGVCFSFSTIFIVWLTHETLPAVAALLPWMLWLIERIYQGGRLGSLLGLAVATAIGLGGGHPGMQVHLAAAAGVYALLRAAFLPSETTLGERVRPLAFACGGLALGALLMAAMLVPEALSSNGTLGTAARSHGRGTLPGTQMPLSVLRTVLFPDWWGRPSSYEAGSPATQLAPGLFVGVNYNERTLFAGTVGLLMALVGVAAPDRWRRKGPFVVLAALGLAIPLHFPGLYQLVTHLPLFDQVQNQRLHFVWALGMAVLAAFGLQALLERPAGDRARLAVGGTIVGLGVVVLGVAFSEAHGGAVGNTVTHFLTGRDFQSGGVLRLTSAIWYLLFALGVAAALLAARRWPERRAWIAAGVVLLAAFDMLHFATGYQPMAPASKVIPPRTGAIAYLQQHRAEGRMVAIGESLPNDWGITYGLRDIRGYDPPQPSLRYFRLWLTVEPGQLDWTSLRMESLSPTSMQVASVLGARWILAPAATPLPREGDPAVHGLRVAYDGADARVIENPRAAPRAIVAQRVHVVTGEDETRTAIVQTSFDPRTEAVVERGGAAGEVAGGAAVAGLGGGGAGAAGGGGGGGGGAGGHVSVEDRSNADVALHATLDRPGLVVLNDDWAPGWSVTVDGRAATALRVNDVVRGVAVPAGAHVVEWRYRVPGLRVGAVLSLLALLGLLAGVGWLVVGRGRGRGSSR